MIEPKRIEGSSCAKFLNTQHTYFHTQVYEIVDSFGADRVNVSQDTMIEYSQNIMIEVDLNNENYAFIETPQLMKKDKERDEVTVYFIGAINNARLSPISEVNMAAEELWLVVRNFVGMHRLSRDKQTSQTDSLMMDLSKPEMAQLVATVGQTSTLALLDKKNKEYQSIKSVLTNLRSVKSSEPASSVRPRTDALYRHICDLIFATYLLTTDAEAKAEIGTLIDHLNQFIVEQKTTYKQSKKRPRKEEKSQEFPDPVPANEPQ